MAVSGFIKTNMKKFFYSIGLIISLCCFSIAQERPLLTDDIDTTPKGAINIAIGSDFLQNAKFPLSGLNGDLTRVGDIRIKTGFASNVEIQLEGVLQNFLSVNSRSNNPAIPIGFNGNSTNDSGDFILSVKVRLKNESKKMPGFGFKFGFEMPNTDEAKGIGTNQTNIFGKFIAQKTFGRQPGETPKLKVFGNLGLGIMTSPLERFSQNDVLLYGLAGIYKVTEKINIASEVNGRISTRNGPAPIGTESFGQFRIGTQIKASGLRFDTAAIFGLTSFSPRTGITFGVTYQSPKVFTPAQ